MNSQAFAVVRTWMAQKLAAPKAVIDALERFIADSAISFREMAAIAGHSLIGNSSASSARPEAIGVTGGLEFFGTNIQRSALTGDITAPAGSNATTLATVNANVGTFGDATHVGRFTVNAKGLVTAASSIAITGLAPAGGATGYVLTKNSTADYDYSWAAVTATGTVTHTAGALTSGQLVIGNGGADITVGNLSGDVTTSGTTATTIAALAVTTGKIAASAVTLAKIQNATASSKLLGSGASGSGAAYAEITLGTGLAMTGTTLSAAGTGGTVTSVGLILPSIFTVTGSPVTGSGTLTGTLNTPLVAPQGRLTLVTGQPVMTSDQLAKTHIYYTAYVGSLVPVYSGSAWTLPAFSSDLDMALDATNHVLNSVYDLFVWSNAGTLSIGAGPAWSAASTVTVTIASPAVVSWTAHGLSEGDALVFTTTGALPTGITAGTTYFVGRSPGANSFNISTSTINAAAGTFINTSGSQSGTHTATNRWRRRGTGAGTTEITQLNGLWTNANSITLTNGAGAGTAVGANQATYVGSFIPSANGQTVELYKPAATAALATGVAQAQIYNAYNRIRRTHRTQDNGAWNSTTSTWRPQDNSLNNRVWYLDGLAQSEAAGTVSSFCYTAAANCQGGIGLNLNATNQTPTINGFGSISGAFLIEFLLSTEVFVPTLGWNYLQGVEANVTNVGQVNFGGNTTGGSQAHQVAITFDH